MAKAEYQEQIVIKATDYQEFKTPTRMVSLDVGCGQNARGDVNVDLTIFPCSNRQKNFVRASATHLPFGTKMVSLLLCSHCLEHVPEPLAALREFERVADVVKLRVPAAYHFDRVTNRNHLYTWNSVTFRNLLSLVFSKVKVEPHPYRFAGRVAMIFNIILKFLINKFPGELQAICE